MLIEGATDFLIAALQRMNSFERRRMWVRVGEIIPLPQKPNISFVVESPILIQATIWEGAWRVAPWATQVAPRTQRYYTSPYIDPDIVRPSFLFENLEPYPEANALLRSAVEIERNQNWLNIEHLADTLRRLEGGTQRAIDEPIPPPLRELEFISRVLLAGDPRLSLQIIQHALRSARNSSLSEESADSYLGADIRQVIAFALMRVPTSSDASELAQKISELVSDLYPERRNRFRLLTGMLRISDRFVELLSWRARARLLARFA
jgi:hypothetical protein